MENKIHSRIFIVGCPRSGTTLLQSLMSAHPLVFSFPESHFFPNVLSGNRMGRVLGIASKKAEKATASFIKMLSIDDLHDHSPVKAILVKSYTDAFVNILDRAAIEKGKKYWIEKTPQHLHYIKPIKRYIRDPKFIHIIRNGEDVVASLYEVTHKYPEIWGGPRTIDQCLERWIEDIGITRKYISRPNHKIIKYEELVSNPNEIIRKTCEFIEIEFNGQMINSYHTETNELILKDEDWKQKVKEPIENKNGKKFLYTFNGKERAYIRKSLEKSTSLAFFKNMQPDQY